MLASAFQLLTEFLWQSSSGWLNEFVASTLPTYTARVTPRDPSTLNLALIGIVTLAIYALVKRWPRRRETVVLERVCEAPALDRPLIAEETPSRGAA